MSALITSPVYAAIPRLLVELTTTQHQGRPLMHLIERNIMQRQMPAPTMSDVLKTLVVQGLELSEEACYFQHFEELLIAYYAARADGSLLALQGQAIQQALTK